MSIRIVVEKNTYFGSISLMSTSTRADKLDDVEQAFVVMMTEMDKGVLRNFGLLTPGLEEAKSGDLTIVARGTSETANGQTLVATDDLFTHKEQGGQYGSRYVTLANAKEHVPGSSPAVISINDLFVIREIHQVLQSNLNVALFSDDISLGDKLALKQLTHEKGLLMMGPDCETAIINDAALCFGNAVRHGNIGIVGASGTSSQELSVCIHEFGDGISQLIGTGRRDLSEKIGGLTMLDVTGMLEADPQTEITVFISKPSVSAVTHRVLERARVCHRPVVVCFFGHEVTPTDEKGLQFARGTKEAALKAVLLTDVKRESLDLHPFNWPLIEGIRARLTPQQKCIRGLLCGGTLYDEATFTAMEKHAGVYSSVHPGPAFRLKDLSRSVAHTSLDFDDGDSTNGRLRPMIDPISRISCLLQEVRDPGVGIIVMDLVPGFGPHEDPAGVMLDAIVKARAIVTVDSRLLETFGRVLGIDLDTPSLEKQRQILTDAGVIWASSGINTGSLAREPICKGEEV